MATEWEGNETLHRFVQLLQELNHRSADMIRSGDMGILPKMQDTVQEMYSIQHAGTEDAYTGIEEDMQAICKNFDAIVTMLKSCESDRPDRITSNAVKKFLHNIFDATVRIVYAYGLA